MNSELTDPNTDHPLQPVINARVEELAAIPPGPEAQSKAADILALIQAMLTNPAVQKIIPVSWMGYIAALVAVIGLVIGAGIAGRVTAPKVDPVVVKAPDVPAPTPIVINVPPAPMPTPATPCLNPTGCKCGCVTTGNCVCKNCDTPMLVKPIPDPITPVPVKPIAQLNRVTIYTTSGTDQKALLSDPALKGITITVAPKIYPPGNVYEFNGKSVPVPCAALIDPAGKVLDVIPLPGSGAELAAWATGKK